MTPLRLTSISDRFIGGGAPDLALTWPLPARDPARIPPSVTPLPRDRRESTTDRAWSLDRLAGRIVELSSPDTGASAGLDAAAALLVQAQFRGEPTAWIAADDSCFFPPDLAETGVDLAALAVVRTKKHAAGNGADRNNSVTTALRAADRLLRSGAFGLVVLDFGVEPPAPLPPANQTRLSGLVHKHQAILLCLTRSRLTRSRLTRSGLTHESAGSTGLGSLVSLRGEGDLRRHEFDRFAWEIRISKDKRHGPGWSHAEIRRGPDGLC